jgi:seryl-tRNA synthetase
MSLENEIKKLITVITDLNALMEDTNKSIEAARAPTHAAPGKPVEEIETEVEPPEEKVEVKVTFENLIVTLNELTALDVEKHDDDKCAYTVKLLKDTWGVERISELTKDQWPEALYKLRMAIAELSS